MAINETDRVVPLDRLDDYEVADGDPDVRGWSVMGADGRKLGRVEQLLVDVDAMKVRYLDVELDGTVGRAERDRHALVPIGYAVLDRSAHTVRVNAAGDWAAVPAYRQEPLSADHAARVDEHWTGWGGRDGEKRLTLSEEELAVRKRERSAGAVEIEKHVETEHVRRTVPLAHEEAVVERRPITDPARATGRIGGDEEIRVPLRAEEAVVEKRVVPKEELVVRKREVVENEVVEADLRKERAEVERERKPP